MKRWALLLEYDGGEFAGWQRQCGQLTAQSALEEAAAKLNDGRAAPSVAAGRTDAGVHAAGQVALISLPDRYGAGQVRDALNYHLRPHAFAVLQAAAAAAGWNPRFDAIRRTYDYRILNRRAQPALWRGRAWHVQRPLDAGAMQAAGEALLGRHDFTSFRARACQARSPWRTLDRIEVRREGEMIGVRVEARSFLHHQVRNMVGTLKLVGEGKWAAARVGEALAARDRTAAGPTAPAEGLTLLQVMYELDPFRELLGSGSGSRSGGV